MTDAEKLAFVAAFKQSDVRHITDPEILRLMAAAAWQVADQLEEN